MNNEHTQPGLGLYSDMESFPYEVLDLSHMPYPTKNKPRLDGRWINLQFSSHYLGPNFGADSYDADYAVNGDGWKCVELAYNPSEKLWLAELVGEMFICDSTAEDIRQNRLNMHLDRKTAKVFSSETEWVLGERAYKSKLNTTPVVIRDIRIPLWAKVWERPGYANTLSSSLGFRYDFRWQYLGQPNANGRIYPPAVMQEAFGRCDVEHPEPVIRHPPVSGELRTNFNFWSNQLMSAMQIPANMIPGLVAEENER